MRAGSASLLAIQREICWGQMEEEADPVQFAARPRQALLFCVGRLWLQLLSQALSSVTAHKKSTVLNAIRSLCLETACVDEREKGIFPSNRMCDQKASISLTGPQVTSRSD